MLITATEKEVSLQLLDNYHFDYVNLGNNGNSVIKKLLNIPVMDVKMYLAARKFKPDIFIGLGSIRASHASFLLRKKFISVEDTECSFEQILLYLPFTSIVFTPTWFKRDLGKKQFKLDAFKELAYLHPNYFTPSPLVLEKLGLKENERFIVVRFISWNASHDIGQAGIKDKIGFVKTLEQYGKVFISSEGRLEKELEQYQIKIPPELFHDLLYYATLYIGEGGSTASESALLGTHAVLIDPEAKQCGNFYDLHSYDLLWFVENASDGLDIAKRLLGDEDLRQKGKAKLANLLKDKIDLTRFLVWFVENYPESYDEIKRNPGKQQDFK